MKVHSISGKFYGYKANYCEKIDCISMPAKAVIFDMDGLLLDTERVCFEGFTHARRHFSLSDSPETFLSCVGLRADASNQIVRDSLDNNTDLDTFNAEWHRHIRAQLSREVPLKQGALQLIRLLASKGYPMAVATSTQTPQAREHLESAGILPHLTCVVGGDLVENGKPDPEVYHKAADHLGALAQDCIAFEDSETGTRAAVASGAKTVQIPDLIQPTASFAKHGQLIAPTILDGAIQIGLISASDL